MKDFDKGMESLKAKLNEQSWPAVYFFKFIVPSENEKVSIIHSLFDDTAEINMRDSSSGKFTSISIKTVMLDVESILEIYRKASKVEGIVSL
jgi:uncharacterized protein